MKKDFSSNFMYFKEVINLWILKAKVKVLVWPYIENYHLSTLHLKKAK